jgi:capsid protein
VIQKKPTWKDIKDYELSERLGAKVAASICVYIRKSLDASVGSI